MAGKENNGRPANISQLRLQLEAGHSWKIKVKNQTSGSIGSLERQVFRGVAERDDLMTGGRQQCRQSLADSAVIVQYIDDRATGAHCFPSIARGIAKLKTVPATGPGDPHKRPWCASMIDLQIESPIPIPSSLVVKKASNTFSKSEIPIP